MKSLAIGFSIFMLLVLLLPGFSLFAEPAHVPHENPAVTQSSADIAAILLSYGGMFDLAALGQYQNARDILDKLEKANIPEELRFIIERYNTMIQQLFTNADNLEVLLDEVSILAADNRISEAKKRLDEAEETINNVRFLMEDIEAAAEVLSDKLGVLSSNRIQQAYRRLQESWQQLRGLIDEMNKLRLSLAESYEVKAVQLLPTEIGFSIAPTSLFVGDGVTAQGRLSSNGSPLSQRKLTIFLDNEPHVVTTDFDGSFTTGITVPYKYVSSMTLKAVYVPSDDDIGTYLDSESPPVVIDTMFHPTHFELRVPETAYPGLPFTVSGQVVSFNDSVERKIQIFLDDNLIAENVVNGQFSFTVKPPSEIRAGKYSLNAKVVPQGRYAGATTATILEMAMRPVYSFVQVPQIALTSRPVKVTGWIYYGHSPPDASIIIDFKNASGMVRTSADGSFTASVDVPLGFSFISNQDLKITIEPLEPWYAPVDMQMRVVTVNPVTTGLLMFALLLIGLFVNRRGVLTGGSKGLLVTAAETSSIYKASSVKGRILSAYINGLDAMVRIVDIKMAPDTTLREFLEAVRLLSPGTIAPFAKLTGIAELALYSARRLDEATAARAEALAAAVRGEL